MMMKSRPRVTPKRLANLSLAAGNIENRMTNSHNIVHRMVVVNDCLSVRYLAKKKIIAITDINGNKIEYNNI